MHIPNEPEEVPTFEIHSIKFTGWILTNQCLLGSEEIEVAIFLSSYEHWKFR